MWFLQISDLHCSPDISGQNQILTKVCEIISCKLKDDKKLAIIICGDITFKGDQQGYKQAHRILIEMKKLLSNLDITFCVCPGNHDITKEKQCFDSFNRFLRQLTLEVEEKGTEIHTFSKQRTVCIKSVNNIDIILINSAYHGSHSYGLININDIEDGLKQSHSSDRIMVVHHNLIPVFAEDRSTIANAYHLLLLAEAYGIKAILHGHGHMQNLISIGENNCDLIGVGSLFFPISANYNNQFNLFNFKDGMIVEAYSYKYIADLTQSGRVSGFDTKQLKGTKLGVL